MVIHRFMSFQSSLYHLTNITNSFFLVAFIIYGIVKAEKFVQFYKYRFYFLLFFNIYGLTLNGIHSLVIQHNVLNITMMSEICLFILLFCLFCLIVYWTYRFYLKFIFSLITSTQFKGIRRLLFGFCYCKRDEVYDYTFLKNGDSESDDTAYTRVDDKMETGWFSYMNYQILGNYILTHLFVIFVTSQIYLIRAIAIAVNINSSIQLSLMSVDILSFVIICGFFDYRYRRFTKSLIMPHLTILTLLGSWILEHYNYINKTQPEPASVFTFSFIFVYIIIKFAFLTDISQIEKNKNN